ncbi:protein of unknown function [Taphrina deformans PYCC 5710]|uniref:U4/U6.U5 small nuclear ribonucleoprotein 27kDa protein domain-containing protein n=1 Tax=Taphrina deformans (strain PYCC 5710 / ATCC 11124 / CBS 356.35 / IMI 108563 / JCM 9778 / NBRC 8474) TaxID=1097556 RepID=R4XF55_TAPDE|nr:protein of unknown function [Taphrina deformans PYCC 5710]|eukprot:CCG84411.1 protein of unknown function [Taphrina deformans PYCC 5710]
MSRSRSRSPYARDHRGDEEHSRKYYHERDSYGQRTQLENRNRPSYNQGEEDPYRRSHQDRSQRKRVEYRERSPNRKGSTIKASYRPVNENSHSRDVRMSDGKSNPRSKSPDHHAEKRDSHRSRQVDGAQTSTSAQVDNGDPEDKDEEAQMAAMLGFGGFSTTKGEKVKGNAKGGVAKAAKRIEYRQYMNRPGGFNRALDDVP